MTGHRLHAHDCEENNTVIIEKCNMPMQEEISRVKHLPGKVRPWCIPNRCEGTTCISDPVTKLLRVGQVTRKKLQDADMHTINNLLSSTHLPPTAPSKTFDVILAAATKASKDEPPPLTNHSKADNPHLSLRGEGNWEAKISQSTSLSGSCC